MIGILGPKRVLILSILILLNVAMAAAVYAYLAPQNEQLDREVRGLKGQVATVFADTQRLREEREQIQLQKARFENLEAAGFFSDQNRVLARTKIEAVQRYTGILSASYNFSPAKTETNPLLAETGYTVIASPATLALNAMDDVDVLKFIYWLENGFPGHISIDTVRINRVMDINDVTLRAIGSGVETTLVKASVGFKWRTMIPNSSLQSSGTGGANGM